MASKRFVVVGLGTFGSGVAETLHHEGHEVVAVDQDELAVDRAAAYARRAVVGDARERDVLERAGAQGADGAVVSTGEDLGASLLVVLALRDLGVREIYAKALSADHARIFTRLGVTESVIPEREAARNLAFRMVRSGSLLNYVELNEDLSLQEMTVPPSWEGQTLRALDLRARFGISVVAVHDIVTDVMTPVPDPDATLTDSQTLVVTGAPDALARAAMLR